MDDVVGYCLMLGAIVLPAYAIFVIGNRIIQAVFENQSMLVSFPIP